MNVVHTGTSTKQCVSTNTKGAPEIERQRETERQRERQRERATERETHRERHTQRDTQRETHSERETRTHTHRQSERKKETETQRESEVTDGVVSPHTKCPSVSSCSLARSGRRTVCTFANRMSLPSISNTSINPVYFGRTRH